MNGIFSRQLLKLKLLSAVLSSLAPRLTDDLKKRTIMGQDVRLAPFKNKITGEKSNLIKSGKMLNALACRPTNKGFAIYFKTATEAKKAAYHQSGTNKMPARRFFGLDAGQKETIKRKLLQFLKDNR